ncbi:hypothetical protein DCO46_20360 [Flavobacterium sp. HTF]|nr:hypothetical protein DCO46_20360 [Flavobacterium sp. HTF]
MNVNFSKGSKIKPFVLKILSFKDKKISLIQTLKYNRIKISASIFFRLFVIIENKKKNHFVRNGILSRNKLLFFLLYIDCILNFTYIIVAKRILL